MSKASKELMSQLHGALAKEMAKMLNEGVTAVNDDGEVIKLTPGAAHLNAIRQFLKDNQIEAVKIPELEEAIRNPQVKLPFSETDEYGLPRMN